jgi:hypothetical protein
VLNGRSAVRESLEDDEVDISAKVAHEGEASLPLEVSWSR